jgi:hypothetical protein
MVCVMRYRNSLLRKLNSRNLQVKIVELDGVSVQKEALKRCGGG